MKDTEQLAALFKLIGDPTRLNILLQLLNGEQCVNDLAKQLNLSQSALSHQLKTLKLGRMVKLRKDGKFAYYALQDEHVMQIISMALAHIQEDE